MSQGPAQDDAPNGLTLFHLEFSTCSQKVRLVLAEKGLAYASRLMGQARGDHLSDWYLAINPNGVVPSMLHNGAPVTDSSVICEYLEEVFPEPPLSPPTALGRAAMRAWMRYFEEVPTVAIRVPSFNTFTGLHRATMGEDAFEAYTDKLPLRKHFYRQMGDKGFDKEKTEESMERLRNCLERVSKAMTDGRAFIMGDNYTLADILLVPTVVRLEDLKLADIWSDLPNVARWYANVQARPSFAIAYAGGARISPTVDVTAKIMKG
jgi:glutathione S-transferase